MPWPTECTYLHDTKLCMNDACPDGCICDGRKFKCEPFSLSNIPLSTTHIEISGSPIDVRDMCRSRRTVLLYLNFSRTGIAEIPCFSAYDYTWYMFHDNHSFFPILRTVDLSGNKFTVMRSWNLPNLEILNLNNNPIKVIESHLDLKILFLAFPKVTNSNFLQGRHDQRMNISFEEHRHNNESQIVVMSRPACVVNVLELSFSKLSHLQNLGHCTSLITVDLRFNAIKALSYDSFNGMSDLENVYLSHNALEAVNIGDLRGLTKLLVLHLDNNLISVIHPRSLYDLQQISVLRLDNNRIMTLDNRSFYYLQQLKSLNLSNNLLEEISFDLFERSNRMMYLNLGNNKISKIVRSRDTLGKLRYLSLENNRIGYISAGIFESLLNLRTLNLRGNDIIPHKDLFNGLGLLQKLHVDSFTICCFRPVSVRPENCLSPSDIFSSCTNMIEVGFLHIFIWFTASFSIYGNIKSLAHRFRSRSWTQESRDILITNLNLSDLLMGIYLIIMAYEDLRTRGVYGEHHDCWMKCLPCKVAGTIMTSSCQMSTLCIFGVTVDRFVIFRYPFSDKQKARKNATIAVIVMWIFSITSSLLPELYDSYFGNDFYGRSSVCISLPLTRTTMKYKAWEYSFALFIVLNLVIYSLIVAGQIAIFRQIKSYNSCGQAEAKKKREVAVAKSLSVVVISDTICWLPVAILGKFGFISLRFFWVYLSQRRKCTIVANVRVVRRPSLTLNSLQPISEDAICQNLMGNDNKLSHICIFVDRSVYKDIHSNLWI